MRSSLAGILLAGLIAAASLSTTAAARPTYQQKQEARANANAGLKAFKVGDWSLALERFGMAEEIIHAPPHLLYMARASTKLGEMLAARELYQRVIDEELPKRRPPKAFAKAQADAKAELEALEEQIPRLSIEVSGPPSEAVALTLNGESVEADSGEMDLNPGEYTVVARADEHQEARQTLNLEAGQRETMTLTLEPVPVELPPPPEEPLPIIPIALIGGGALGIGVGIVTGAMALDSAAELRDTCPQNPCPTEHESLADDANTLATVSTVGFVVGGVAVAAGGAWLIWDLVIEPEADGEPMEDMEEEQAAGWELRPVFGPGYAGVTGRF
ncbi:MAG: hypothetical protein JRI68_17405 [Deltaproteobacteria bacterium]|nr:hypothetical protein [Deltaproteobacteria bacterium]